ncbi:MAG TPA: hypothetical protein VHU61_12900 [Solirubrobacteraceae bacterium]|jgi:hypothetical protein|nr:hypothetical protein [Solirubrobacteraceae bacterium]
MLAVLAAVLIQLHVATPAAAAGTWSEPVVLGGDVYGGADEPPRLAEDGAGAAVAVWSADDESYPLGIDASYRAAGGAFGTATAVSASATAPSVGIDSNGDATLGFTAGAGDANSANDVYSGMPAFTRLSAGAYRATVVAVDRIGRASKPAALRLKSVGKG